MTVTSAAVTVYAMTSNSIIAKNGQRGKRPVATYASPITTVTSIKTMMGLQARALGA